MSPHVPHASCCQTLFSACLCVSAKAESLSQPVVLSQESGQTGDPNEHSNPKPDIGPAENGKTN